MSTKITIIAPITFEDYKETLSLQSKIAKRDFLTKYCSPFFLAYETALANGQMFCDFKVSINQELPFPWSLVASEFANRYPDHNTSVISLVYEPNPEHEIYVDSYKIRIERNS